MKSKKPQQMLLGNVVGYTEEQKIAVIRDLFGEWGRRGGSVKSEKKLISGRKNTAYARSVLAEKRAAALAETRSILKGSVLIIKNALAHDPELAGKKSKKKR